MVRGTLIALTALVLACGGERPEGSTATAPGGGEGTAGSEAASTAGGRAAGGMVDASASERCLRLMSARDYETAVQVCAEALELEPSNLDVEHALAKAKSEVASAAYNAADTAKEAEAAAGKLLE